MGEVCLAHGGRSVVGKAESVRSMRSPDAASGAQMGLYVALHVLVKRRVVWPARRMSISTLEIHPFKERVCTARGMNERQCSSEENHQEELNGSESRSAGGT